MGLALQVRDLIKKCHEDFSTDKSELILSKSLCSYKNNSI